MTARYDYATIVGCLLLELRSVDNYRRAMIVAAIDHVAL